jgi:hypothetical protein
MNVSPPRRSYGLRTAVPQQGEGWEGSGVAKRALEVRRGKEGAGCPFENPRRSREKENQRRWTVKGNADLNTGKSMAAGWQTFLLPQAWGGSIPLFCRLEADGYVAAGVGTCKRGLKSSRGVLCGKILPHLRSSRFLPLLQKSSSPCLREGLPPTPLDLTAVCHARAARRVHGGGGGGIPGFSRRHSASQPGECFALTEPNLGRPGERTALFWGSQDRSRARPRHGGGGGRCPFPLLWIMSLL